MLIIVKSRPDPLSTGFAEEPEVPLPKLPLLPQQYAMQRDRGQNAKALDVLLFPPPKAKRRRKGA